MTLVEQVQSSRLQNAFRNLPQAVQQLLRDEASMEEIMSYCFEHRIDPHRLKPFFS